MLRLPTENTSDKEKKMEHWNEAKIKDFAKVKGGKRLPKGKQLIKEPNSHPYIRIRDLGKTKYLQLNSEYEYVDNETQQSIARYIVNKGDILISVVGTIGLIGIVGETLDKANQTENCDKIINIKNVLPEYLYYYLISSFGQDEIRKGTVGAVQPKLPLKNVQDITIFYPSIEEQERIVNILSSVDEKIETNNAINNNLEQQAQSIFDNMFPNISNGSCTIGDYITPKRGKSLLSKNAIFGDVPVIAGGLEPSTYHNVANTQSPVLAISASGANAGYVSLWNIPIWSSDSSYIDSSMTDDVYFWYVLLKKRQKEIFDAQTGSAQPHIYPQHITSMSVSNLDIEEVHSYTSIVTPIFEIIGHHKEENARLASLRDTLLPKLMSGELDVSNI